jgi:hypothetical protein
MTCGCSSLYGCMVGLEAVACCTCLAERGSPGSQQLQCVPDMSAVAAEMMTMKLMLPCQQCSLCCWFFSALVSSRLVREPATAAREPANPWQQQLCKDFHKRGAMHRNDMLAHQRTDIHPAVSHASYPLHPHCLSTECGSLGS